MKKNPSRHFWRTLTIMIIIFSALYIAMESGYYDTKLGMRVELTEEKIKEFENDIKNGKEIDVKDYLKEDFKDYSNKVSRAGMGVAGSTEKFMTKGIMEIFKFIGTLFF